MPVPTIKDLFTPINSIGTCLESKAAIISKNLVDINNSITGAATTLGEKSKSIKDSIDDAKKDIIKSLKDLSNTKVEKPNQGTNAKNIEKLSKEFSSNLATGITSISTTFANSMETAIGSLNGINLNVRNVNNTINDFKKGVLKHIGNSLKREDRLGNFSQRKMKSFSKEIKDGLVSGISLVSASVQQAITTIGGSISELGMGVAQATQILVEINKSLAKTNVQLKSEKRRERREERKIRKNLTTGKQTLEMPNIKGSDDVGKSVENIARAVRAVGDISLKDIILFKSKLKKMIRGIVEPIKEYNENLKPGEGVKIAKDIEELGSSLSSFVRDMSKTTLNGVIASKFVGKDPKKSPLNKLLGSATYAVLTNVYGATYNKKTGKYSNFDKKQAAMLSSAGTVLNKLGSSILKFNAKLALSAVLAPAALLGAALFRLEIPLIKSGVNALLGKGTYNKRKELKYIAAGIILDRIGTSILMFNAKMALSTILAPVAAVGLGLFALLMVETSMVFSYLANKKTKLKFRSGARTLNMITGSILGFEAYMVLSILLAPAAMVGLALATPIMLGANAIFRRIGSKRNRKRVIEGSLAVTLMGLSIIAFSASMLVATMITKRIITGGSDKVDPTNLVALAAVVPIFGLMIGGHYLMQKIGTIKSVKESLNFFAAITLMSAGLVVFSLGMLVATAITKNMWKTSGGKFDTISMITSVSVFGLMFVGSKVFQMAGQDLKGVAKGLASVTLMSIGLGIFGFGLSFYSKSTKDLKTKDIVAMPLLLAGFAVEFGIMGATVEFITLGGAAAAAMGVGVGAFGLGLKSYSESIKDVSKDDVIRMAKVIGLYGVEFAGIGLISHAILGADLAFAAMGGSLLSFGKGISIYMDSIKGYDEEQLKLSRSHIGKLGGEFALLGLASPAILAAGVATTTIGAGLASLGKGMKSWKDVGGVSDDELANLCKTVDAVKLAFMGSVDENGKPKKVGGLKGFLKSVSGAIAAPFNLASVVETATSLTVAGGAIVSMAKSLKYWEDSNINIDSVANLTTVIAAMNEAFGKMAGRTEKSEKGLLGHLIGTDFSVFSPTDVELGIRSTKNMGKALKNIAEGVVSFRDGIGKEFTDKTKAYELGTAITNVITPIAQGFGALEGLEPYENQRKKGLLGNIITGFVGELGSPAGKTKIATGIKSVKDLGKTLKDLAEGVKEFATLIPKNAKASWLKDVGDNIGAVLTALQGPLIALGTSETEISQMVAQANTIGTSMESVYTSMGNVSKISAKRGSAKEGVEAIKGLGETLVGIANATKTFSEISLKQLGTSGTWNDNWEITSPGEGALGAMTAVLCSQFALFSKLGVTVKETGTYEETKKEGNIFNRKVSTTSKSYIGMAIDSISNLGATVSDIGDALKKFSSNEWKDGAITGASDAFRTILSFTEAFGTLGYVMLNGTSYKQQFNALSSKGWNQEVVSKFGTISDSTGLLLKYSEALAKGSDLIKGVVTSYNDVFVKTNNNIDVLKKFYDKPEYIMYPVYNVLEMTRILAATNEEEIHMINNKGRYVMLGKLKLTPQTLDNAIANTNKLKEIATNITTAVSKLPSQTTNAKGAKEMKSAISNLTDGFKEIETLKPITTTSFDNLVRSMSKSLRVLDGKGKSLDKATKLVDRLIVAKKNNVFGDLSRNTQNIANAINNLAKDNLKPYSELIAALGKMSDHDSKYKELFDDIIDLLKKMNAELAKENSNVVKGETTGDEGSTRGSGSNGNKNEQ
ncbi:MAG: MFS transporter, partial [Alphaproteobacteria bacterium]|nr:MFS transporter [Alphaproteobacteria bacterium]